MMNKTMENPVADLSDEITLQNLKDIYKLNKEALDNYYEGKSWLHRDDLEHCSLTIHHLKAVIEYYGGSVE